MRRNRRQTKTVNRKPKIVNCGENKSWERGRGEIVNDYFVFAIVCFYI